MKDYEIGVDYPLSELDNISQWWQTHRQYDVNEYEDHITLTARNSNTYLEELRDIRQELLTAFDIYKSNVEYGIEEETEQEHLDIIVWYKDLRDLKGNAFNNVPERISYYVGRK